MFPHLGENLLVRPPSLADKMQQRLMLGSSPPSGPKAGGYLTNLKHRSHRRSAKLTEVASEPASPRTYRDDH
jgi:hypothetical protein